MEKIKIWGKQIPYNTGKEKFNDRVELMDRTILNEKMHTYFAKGEDPNRDPVIRRQVIMQDEIGTWGAKETYDDEPLLMPFPVEGSSHAVIIVPGGAYVMKSMEHEGTEVAQLLNREGISCFVLWYRSYPYSYPVPYLDVQRAVRYVKHHAAEYGIEKDQVAVMGFSAGGNAVAGSFNMLRNNPVQYETYKADEVDLEDATPAALGLIYAALEVSRDPQCLHMLSGKEDFSGAEEEEQDWIRKLDLKQYVKNGDPRQFLCYGTKDQVVLPQPTEDYCKALDEKNVEHEVLKLEGADHGFGSCLNPHREAEYIAEGWHKKFAEWLLWG